MLPIFQQFVFPSLTALFAFIYSFFPQQAQLAHTKVSRAIQHEKKVVANAPSSSSTKKQTPNNGPLSFGNTAYAQDHTTTPEPTSDQTPVGDLHSLGSNISVPRVTSTPSPAKQAIIHATTSITSGGKIIHFSMQYPNNGGKISGTISGDCNGTITGNYDGSATNMLYGSGSASCPMEFISIPVSISYSGKLQSSTQAAISYTIEVMGKKESGLTTLFLSH
jgi:hypothetical protein